MSPRTFVGFLWMGQGETEALLGAFEVGFALVFLSPVVIARAVSGQPHQSVHDKTD